MKDYRKLVWLLFLAIVIIRLAIAFSSPYFDYDSYFHIKHIENIAQTGLPAWNDQLSYGGGVFVFSPLFHYLMAALSLIVPIGIIGKIVPNVLYALLVPLSYYIANEITGKRKLALIAPVVVAFMPVLWSNIFSLNPLCITIPAIFYAFYCVVKENDPHRISKFLVSVVIAAFSSPISIIAIPILWGYLLFLRVGKTKIESELVEVSIFSTFFIVLTQFLFYKNAILANGASVIWQNIPAEIIRNYFAQVSILDIIANIGILPFIFGIYYIYMFSFEKKKESSSLFVAIALAAGILIWARLIPVQTGMIFLGLGISVISVDTIKQFMDYFQKIRFRKARLVMALLAIFFLFSAAIPAFGYFQASKQSIPGESEINGMLWLRENSSENSVIAGSVKDGFMINEVAKRRNIIDGNFLMNPYSEERFQDVSALYTTNFETSALELMNKYSSKYIFFGKNVRTEYNASKLNFEDKKCFLNVFDENNVKIYKTWCQLE